MIVDIRNFLDEYTWNKFLEQHKYTLKKGTKIQVNGDNLEYDGTNWLLIQTAREAKPK